MHSAMSVQEEVAHIHRLHGGVICCRCFAELATTPPNPGMRFCPACDPHGHLRRVNMHFHHYREHWVISFQDFAGGASLGGIRQYRQLDTVRAILQAANPTAHQVADFEQCVRSWGQGGVYLDLTPTQYARLKR